MTTTLQHRPWYVVPDYQPPGKAGPSITARIVNARGELVAHFESIEEARDVAGLGTKKRDNDMSDLMKRAHELAPFVANALREVADEAAVPNSDEREWTDRQKASRDFSVELARALLIGDNELLGNLIAGPLGAHAEAGHDAGETT